MSLYLVIGADGKNYMGNRNYICKKTGIPAGTLSHAFRNTDRYVYYDGTIIRKVEGIEVQRNV